MQCSNARNSNRDYTAPCTKTGKRRAKLGRNKGYRPSEKHAEKVLARHRDGLSYRLIARKLGLSKNAVRAIVQRANQPAAA